MVTRYDVESTRRVSAEYAEAMERYRGVVLTDTQMVGLLERGNPQDPGAVALWFGSSISSASSPFGRYGAMADNVFPSLPPRTRETVLVNGARFVIGDFRKRYKKDPDAIDPSDGRLGPAYNPMSAVGAQFIRATAERNLAVLLREMVKHENGNLEGARKLVDRIQLDPEIDKSGLSLSASFLYTHGALTPELRGPGSSYDNSLAVKERYVGEEPKIAQLAFWVDIKSGFFAARKKARNSGEIAFNLFPRLDNGVKAEFLRYLSDNLANRAFTTETEGWVLMMTHASRSLYEAVKAQSLGSKFVKEYEGLVGVLAQNMLMDRVSRGVRISPRDLFLILQIHPELVRDVSANELRAAIRSAVRPEIVTGLEKFLEEKST